MDTSRNTSVTNAGRTLPRLFVFLLVVFFMTNIGALVDRVFHPEIEYFDEEHLIAGFITGILTLILFGGLAFYALRLEKALAMNRKTMVARQQSDDKYHRLFETLRDIIFISTPSGRFLDINPAGAQILVIPR